MDFLKNISAYSYFISTRKKCYWVNKWNVSISFDDINWKYVSSVENNYTGDVNHYFEGLVNFRYLRIYGSSYFCSGHNKQFAMNIVKIFGYINPFNHKYAFFSCDLCKLRINLVMYFVFLHALIIKQ